MHFCGQWAKEAVFESLANGTPPAATSRSTGSVDPTAQANTEELDHSLAIVLEPTMSSSLNFGSRIKSLHSENVTDSVGSTSICDASPDNVYNLEPGGLKHRTTSTDITWPSEEQAHDLLNTVLASIGSLQHLIDPRSFSDKLCSFYEDDSNRTGIDDLCYIEILMVFALGELLQGKMEEGSTFPGATYFLEAVSCLPSLCDLRKSGTLAIEIMGLFAFFLQCSDRKDDARLAAATGNPVGILDDNITTKLPIESAGFSPTPALKINIEIARLSGLITQGLYGLKGRSEGQFLRTVHDLLGELKSVRRDLAAEFPLEFSKAFTVTRTGATLYLMLFQAIILTTRPILLHLAKSKLQALFELPDHTSRFSNSLGFDNESYDIPSIDDIGDFNLDFGNDFMLTGADEIDWEEFERQIPRNQ
ncbi:unnamed protein product [Alternaria alternata]